MEVISIAAVLLVLIIVLFDQASPPAVGPARARGRDVRRHHLRHRARRSSVSSGSRARPRSARGPQDPHRAIPRASSGSARRCSACSTSSPPTLESSASAARGLATSGAPLNDLAANAGSASSRGSSTSASPRRSSPCAIASSTPPRGSHVHDGRGGHPRRGAGRDPPRPTRRRTSPSACIAPLLFLVPIVIVRHRARDARGARLHRHGRHLRLHARLRCSCSIALPFLLAKRGEATSLSRVLGGRLVGRDGLRLLQERLSRAALAVQPAAVDLRRADGAGRGLVRLRARGAPRRSRSAKMPSVLQVEIDPAEAGFDAQRLPRIDRHYARYVDEGQAARLPVRDRARRAGGARGAKAGSATSRPGRR